MLFNSLEFLLFFAVLYPAYLLSGHRLQNVLLLAGSYFFYGAWDYRFLGLILASTVIDYTAGLGINAAKTQARREIFLWISIGGNLGILGFFKYYGFFVESFEQFVTGIGFNFSLPLWQFALPVGISFYTFQTMSYTIDIYRGNTKPTRNFVDFALFVSFFPQLVAGPIERAGRMLPQISQPRRVTLDKIYEGVYLILWGLFLKIYVADNLANIMRPIFAPGADADGSSVLIGAYAFAFFAYGDFAGYSNIARGLARCLGFKLMVNFNLPYLAGNPGEFWRRWHISMSTWFRDYVYLPLGGSRHSNAMTCRNLFLTMLLSGVWHGAGWTFIMWGAFQGTLLAGHRALKPALARISPAKGTPMGVAYHALTVVVFFHVLAIGWPAFLCGSASELITAWGRLFSWDTITGLGEYHEELRSLAILVGPLAIIDTICFIKRDLDYFYHTHWAIRALFYYYLIFCLVFYGDYGGSEYFYFQF